jgi:hypothetical protein
MAQSDSRLTFVGADRERLVMSAASALRYYALVAPIEPRQATAQLLR